MRFFGVDRPETQAWKRNRLSEAEIATPASLTFVPIDFEQSTVAAGLAEAGLDRARGAVFVWLGVSMYLTRTSVEDTLGYVADRIGPSEVVFDYLYPVPVPSHEPAGGQQARMDRVAAVGEPWLSFFTSDEIRNTLLSIGYQRAEDRSAAPHMASKPPLPHRVRDRTWFTPTLREPPGSRTLEGRPTLATGSGGRASGRAWP